MTNEGLEAPRQDIWSRAAIQASKEWREVRRRVPLSRRGEHSANAKIVALEYETTRLNRDATADSNLTDSYSAWCRNNGNHTTRSRGHIDWNAQLMWKMRMELEFQWEILQEEISRLFNVLEGDVSRELINLKEATIMCRLLPSPLGVQTPQQADREQLQRPLTARIAIC